MDGSTILKYLKKIFQLNDWIYISTTHALEYSQTLSRTAQKLTNGANQFKSENHNSKIKAAIEVILGKSGLIFVLNILKELKRKIFE